MEKCRMNYQNARPYSPQNRDMSGRSSCCRPAPKCCCDMVEDTGIYEHADQLPLTMAYVPMQKYTTTFDLCKGLQMGTIFPELCKPFCGKRGKCR